MATSSSTPNHPLQASLTTATISSEGAVSGSTELRNEVVSQIVGLAVREVPGVHGLLPYGATEAITSVAQTFGADQKRDLGVRVELGTVECAIEVRLAVEYGTSIPDMAKLVRDVVTTRVREMCGLEVKELNIEVASLYFETEPVAPTSRQLR